jgi:hypothetical protein
MRNSITQDVDFVGRMPWQTEYEVSHEMLQMPVIVRGFREKAVINMVRLGASDCLL